MSTIFGALTRVQPQIAAVAAAVGWEDGDLAHAPGEAMAAQRSEVDAFEALLGAVEAFQQDVAAATAQLAAAPAPLLKALEKCCGDSPAAWGPLVPQLKAQFDKAAAGLAGGANHTEAMHYLVHKCRAESEEVQSAFKARDAAWAPKVRCDKRASELTRRGGPHFLVAEKAARLKQQFEANEDFTRCTDEAAKAAGDFLERRWGMIGALLFELCKHHAAVLSGAQKTAAGFEALAGAWVPPASRSRLAAAPTPRSGARAWVERAHSPEARELPPPRCPVASPPTLPPPAPTHRGVAARLFTCHSRSGLNVSSPRHTPRARAATPPPRWASARGAPSPPGTASVPAPPPPLATLPMTARMAAPTAQWVPPGPLAEGDAVQVWSASAQGWYDGVVERIFDKAQVTQGYWVTAGSIKVVFPVGTKYVRPEDVASIIRRRPLARAWSARGFAQN